MACQSFDKECHNEYEDEYDDERHDEYNDDYDEECCDECEDEYDDDENIREISDGKAQDNLCYFFCLYFLSARERNPKYLLFLMIFIGEDDDEEEDNDNDNDNIGIESKWKKTYIGNFCDYDDKKMMN